MRSLRLNRVDVLWMLPILAACSSSTPSSSGSSGSDSGGDAAQHAGATSTGTGGSSTASGGKASTGSGGKATTNGGTTSSSGGKGGTIAGGGRQSSGGAGGASSAGSAPVGGDGGAGDMPTAGWLHTSGNKIMVSDASGNEKQWVGRGVNIDDIFFCGYNTGLWMDAPETEAKTIVNALIDDWKPNFIRLSLAMASFDPTTSWLSKPEQYKTPMTSLINAIGAKPGTYVLVTLRSDASMIGHDDAAGPEPTGFPSDSKTTPDSGKFPTGTDALYVALVDSFANSSFVLFGLTNEPGGNVLSNSQISKGMSHAVDVIRAEEDRLGVPHHVVAVQGNGWSSDISFYSKTPLTQDNVIYEVHGYPPPTDGYTYSNIPVFIGEYGGINATSFYADLETKKISSLAWDLDPYSDCSPDLLDITQKSSPLKPNDWGNTVKKYLVDNAGK